MEQERIISSESRSAEEREHESLRPRFLRDCVGQESVKKKLGLFIEAARQRGDALDHVLLAGPPGLGKTTLSHVIANELASQIHTVTGPNVEKKGDLAAILTNLQPNDVLFIDEIHRLPRAIEEVLYGAMEDFKIDIIIGQGPGARTVSIDLPKFTLVGATTRTGLLTGPLRDRFGVHLRLDFYPDDELEDIVLRSAKLLKVIIDETGANEIARRSRGTPRIVNRLLKRVRDFAQVTALKRGEEYHIDRKTAEGALELLEIDRAGLDAMDRKLLLTIIEKFSGGPVGVENLCSALGEQKDTIEEIYEPYLIQRGFVQRTPRGRMTTPLACEHFGLTQASTQLNLEARQ